MPSFWREVADGVVVSIRLTPRSSGERIEARRADGAGEEHLAVRVRAVPEKNQANAALLALIAGALGVPKSAVTLVSGPASRTKSVHVAGDPAMLGHALDRL